MPSSSFLCSFTRAVKGAESHRVFLSGGCREEIITDDPGPKVSRYVTEALASPQYRAGPEGTRSSANHERLCFPSNGVIKMVTWPVFYSSVFFKLF